MVDVRNLRTGLGLTQEQLAAVLGATRVSVGRWETDEGTGHVPRGLPYSVLVAVHRYGQQRPGSLHELGASVRESLLVDGNLRALRTLLEHVT